MKKVTLWVSVFLAYLVSAILYVLACCQLLITMFFTFNVDVKIDIWLARQSIRFDDYAKQKSGFKCGMWE